MSRIGSVGAAILITAVGACASHKEATPIAAPAPAASAPRPMAAAPAVPDVAGEWTWSATVGGNVMDGTMHLDHATPSGYSGTLSAQGMALPVKEVVITGRAFSFKVEGPDGIYTLKGILTDDKTMDGALDGPPGPGSFKAKKS